ncbi:lasso peptide biosynthesis B2 protein [Nocardiopsis salina]|uniref:lasso peptide biosynthesis B2 protein n=1 Tax=Nocardiopsis salina TaxID=245836 RepID=UPI000A04285D|nr:lasso peptide biosynthesis B2 protein [Nocardiopsis salina]
MSVPEAFPHRPRVDGLRRRVRARLAVMIARPLSTRSPHTIRRSLEKLRGGARPAGLHETFLARQDVESTSLHCAGPEGCVQRSIATAVLCRLGGSWPTWCVGVRTRPPFGAHAWVEAEGTPVGEDGGPVYFTALTSVGVLEEKPSDD